jgi:hypothetical protein
MAEHVSEEPTATLRTLRLLRSELVAIAGANGITGLRVTPEGRLYGAVDHDRPWGGIFDFERGIADTLGIRVEFVSDGALENPGNTDEARLEAL